jgi:4-amino-4-deoxy-L-arabinose transferase-like glycosyltransferase
MRSFFSQTLAQMICLIAITAVVVFPNLGATSLWDDDEGVNAECTREMMETGTWVVPTFNGELRTAKPILLYWLMRGSYSLFGVGEWAARFPSAMMMFAIVLLTYDLGRRIFDATTGFLAGLIGISTLELAKLAHAVTTDSTLIACSVLYFWAFWRGTVNNGRSWFVPCGIASGLAMLTKGPAVGVILPSAIVISFFAWNRTLKRMLDWRMLGTLLSWLLVTAPWYILVATETKGEWPRAFFFNENLGRASEPMENHRGIPVVYEFGMICIFFAPWSAFLAISIWNGFRGAVRKTVDPNGSASSLPDSQRCGLRLLLLWVGMYVLACSAARTKLPHYIAPAYPALAILTAHFFTSWLNRLVSPPRWVFPWGIVGVASTGVVVVVALMIADGSIASWSSNMRVFPGLLKWAWIGLIPIGSAIVMLGFLKRDQRTGVLISLVAGTILFVGLLVAFPPLEVDRRKAVKDLVWESGARQLDREVRVASYEFTRPSLTFYVGRRVHRFADPASVAEFLTIPIESYLFIPEHVWDHQVRDLMSSPFRILARKYDYERHCTILAITNR